MVKEAAVEIRALEKFREIIEKRHQYAQEWKARTGGKVVGYFCTYVPEEIIYAAGALPVRILGSHEPQDLVDKHIFSFYCSYCRDTLAQGLQGRYGYLDGLTTTHCCIHIRQAYDSWQRHVPVSFQHYVYMPDYIQSVRAKPPFVQSLKLFKTSLEKWLGRSITPRDIDGAIEVYNQNRRLLRQVYELRKKESLPVTAAEVMRMVMASQVMDKAEHNVLLEEALSELKTRPGKPAGIRLLVVGSELDEPEIMDMIESLGGSVVADDLCTGSRYFWNEAQPKGYRLSSIAQRYIDRPPCPLKDLEKRRRLTHLLNLVREYNVQGVIMVTRKFCDPHGFDSPSIQAFMEKDKIPTLTLEMDWFIPVGQFRIRIEAFLELIQSQIV